MEGRDRMKLQISPQWHVIAILAAVVVVGFRAGTILSHGAWSKGKDTTMGRIDDIQASRRVRVIRYSYSVNGKHYTGEETGREQLLEGVPARVTYARSDPSVSTLSPEALESRYQTSLLIAWLGVLPVLIMWCVELAAIIRRRT